MMRLQDRKGSVAEDCDNDRRHLCWCTRENLSYTGPAIWRKAFVHNDKQRGGATTVSQCAKKLLHNVQEKKTTAQRATVPFFSSQPQPVTTINPNFQLPPMVVTTSTDANILTILGVEETLSTQCTLFIKSELFSGENSKKRPVGVCVHRDVLALLGNAAIWFHYSPLHYPLHLSILLLAQHTLNLSL